jgi:hypothetical protein
MDEAATALLAAWNRLDEYLSVSSTLSEMVAGEQRRAEAAEAKLAERDAENARLREGLKMFTAIWSRPYYAGQHPSRDDDIDAAVNAAIDLLNKEITK